MAELEGNCLVAQSGVPTAVFNASLAGVIEEALNYECLEEIYGSINGVAGILNESFVDLASESQQVITGLKHTPGAALGASRVQFKKQADLERTIEVFKAHDIRYFFYIGDREAMAAADELNKYAQEVGYDLRVIGVPKSMDNDIQGTDHSPGYGSAIKHVVTTALELASDNDSVGNHDLVTILEVGGNNAGWIAAGAALAKGRDRPHDPPHLIYLPEIPFNEEKYVEDVQRILKREKYCLIVAAEGMVDEDSNYLTQGSTATDAFGHMQLGGTGEYLKNIAEQKVGVNARTMRLGISQRSSAHSASETDAKEAYLAGAAAVEKAISGETGKMVTLQRGETDQYNLELGLIDLSVSAEGSKALPPEWINDDGVSMNFPFVKYASPFIKGELAVAYENGIPVFSKLKNVKVDRLLASYEM